MQPVSFPQANRTLTAPQGMNEEECGNLPILTDEITCLSCWQMTFGERISALVFGRVWLYVVSGKTQPPVALSVSRDVFRSTASFLKRIFER